MRLLEATDVVIRRNDRAIVQGASLQLRPGEMVGLIGPNGAGKSTLLRALLGLQPLSGGRCLLKGRDLRGWPPRERARELAYLPQNPQSHWPLRVDKVIELGRSPHLGLWRGLTPADRAAIERAIALTEVEDLTGRVFNSLSGGEQARVNLARILASQAPGLLADEPIAALDPYHQLHIMEIFARHAREGGSVLLVLHDLNTAARFCDRLVLLERGQVACTGTPCDVLTADLLRRVYGVDTRWIGDALHPFLATTGRAQHHP